MMHSSRHGSETCTISPFEPSVPVEIVMQILEAAAALSHDAAASVSLVSSWARKLALPYLFSTIIHRQKPLTHLDLQNSGWAAVPTSRSPLPAYLGRYVRSLWTESIGIASPTSEIDFLKPCVHVEHLALPTAALRVVFMLCQTVAKSGRKSQLDAPLLSSLHSLTLLTHTLRYEWHFLKDLRIPNGTLFLHNITHLRLLDMQISAYVPHELLPNLTHLAVPYLDLGANVSRGHVRLPDGILDHKSMRMIVLTVDERKFLHNPWYHIMRYPTTMTARADDVTYTSPRDAFRGLMQEAREKDERIYVVLSPQGQTSREEWIEAARGGMSIWGRAVQARNDANYGTMLPEIYHPT
ncbi:uncharacterized protein LAESUDRAFT_700190 [Laetiporus sulphureus 93-53]|uniref:Uncharacterized protein n=1 Tax=Laetiporus sulphureus 93-53 TaxID=1314785 RepID=A0A165E850_9APHY|nr:uncharacterized protein LAESUDRAFT_700190 [Laetiporus sulphureus 93-53]KZT06429.1 hypothetical protein LAESUDRAFT_700190 [Laetiporus sulphureus 93-53]